jgi:plasmid stabilization system protein ParE
MTLQRSECFDADLKRQFRWYLVETALDPADALALGTRFAEAVDAALILLEQNPEIGRIRFEGYRGLRCIRSWQIRKPFHRFVIFYRVKDETVFAERLLEGHSRIAARGW